MKLPATIDQEAGEGGKSAETAAALNSLARPLVWPHGWSWFATPSPERLTSHLADLQQLVPFGQLLFASRHPSVASGVRRLEFHILAGG